MIKILIADDHPIIRKGLRHVLSDSAEAVVVDEADNGRLVLDKVRKNDYDVILLDISMPGMSGLDILRQIRDVKPKLPVLILSMHPEEQYAVRVLRAGASGYLTKDSVPDELITAIRKVAQGKKYVSPSLAEKLAYELDADEKRPPHERLSDREYQVMRMIASGKTVKEIAEELSLSVKTISTFRTRILTKMAMKNNAEVTYYAVKAGLVG
ncbi:MAG: response regulator transcription factor [Deltaproteobacteria bacterium]|nr:response regulator transcription factor [Deltaproteobacteria bacterium]